jgi:hypothetical protein
LLLGYAIEARQLEEIAFAKAVIEQAKSPADNGGWLGFLTDAPGQTDPRRRVRMIGDIILGLETQPATESKIGA